MNLRVDLILPTEQRSASVVSIKSLVRITVIIIPVVLFIIIALAVMNMMRYKSELNGLDAQWKDAEPKKAAAAALRTDLAANIALRSKLTGWTSSRINWQEQLKGIQKEIPAELRIQLSRLGISSGTSLDNKIPARGAALTIQGTAFGENAEQNVQNLKQALLKSPVLAGCVEQVDVTRFEASTSLGASKSDRLFQIDVKYKPRKFE
jgi:hypothetical protein